ncbi:DUF2000 domain-containing protein [Streptomyces sp. NBC_01795]|uniref:DUF2000 domain-containing protein n=1 Tax=unclassified Streptomyces TaxID=2593676 RepID=UPI002DD9557E|nr:MULTISPECIES: DUF2000 domain-containing protein [unclassified Streptomyces]WSA95000.1 DUF2000 domain-containing protein [Streptomyces sp. NBC_01795]WSB79421.1 DUF2000 domain-containing protein [Streptomyces sp. NBC_01775]WSS12375.1 DUF2000 domain-containing protein [Streptomyces sp. NBC_01186]
MRSDTKIAVIVRSGLADWQKLNVTAFLAGGIATATDEVMGEPYEDGSGNRYLPMFREPVLCFAADAEELATVHGRALSRGLATAVYTDELFATGNDADNRAAVRAVEAGKLTLAGLAVYGPRNAVDRTTKGLKLHG